MEYLISLISKLFNNPPRVEIRKEINENIQNKQLYNKWFAQV